MGAAAAGMHGEDGRGGGRAFTATRCTGGVEKGQAAVSGCVRGQRRRSAAAAELAVVIACGGAALLNAHIVARVW
jgi:hypothetical protein